jgi:putative proteasome-type protease
MEDGGLGPAGFCWRYKQTGSVMTYCVGLRLDGGLVFASDTRTNAGFDNIAVFRKMHVWEREGDRVLVILSAGNLAVTQSVISVLNEQMDAQQEHGGASLLTVETMYQAARVIGDAVRHVRQIDGPALEAANSSFAASFILGGQIHGEPPRLFQIYAEGNFIEATKDTPFFQIGEHKYGKPILDRVARPDMSIGDAAKLILLSFDSTLRSNLSVGMPIDLMIYQRDSLTVGEQRRIGPEDAYFKMLSKAWSEGLRNTFAHIDSYEGVVET